MVRILTFSLFFTFSCALLLAQSDPAIKNLKMDRLVMKTGDVFNGLFIEQNLRELVFKIVEKKIDSPLRTFELTVERKEVEAVIRISPKDRALLETQLKELANPNAMPVKEAVVGKFPNILNDSFDVELVPQVGLFEPTRVRECINPETKKKMTFLISPNTNKVYVSPSEEKHYLALRKGVLIQGNEQTGNITDAVYYRNSLLTASDTGHLTTWKENGFPDVNKKVLGKPIRQITPFGDSRLIDGTSLLIIDFDWQFHLWNNLGIQSFETYELPLINLMETSGLIVAKHGQNRLTVWSKKTGKIFFSQQQIEPFDYLINNNETHLLARSDSKLKIFQIKTNKLISSYPIDLDSYTSFVDISTRYSIDDRSSSPASAVLFQKDNVRWYLNLEDSLNTKPINNEFKTFEKTDENGNRYISLRAEIPLIEESLCYPGIRKINDKVLDANKKPHLYMGSSEIRVVTLTRSGEQKVALLGSIDRRVDAFIQNFKRPLAQWSHVHVGVLPPGNKLDFEKPYKYTSIPIDITPATTTIFLEDKVAYFSGDKYFHLLGGFKNNFKLERGDYFHVGNVCVNNNGTRIAHSAHNSFMYVWDIEKKTKIHTLKGDSPPLTLALSGDGNTLLSCHEGGKLISWDMETGKEKSEIKVPSKPIKAILNFDGTKAFLHCDGNQAFGFPTNANITLESSGGRGSFTTMPLAGGNFAVSMPAFTWDPTWKPVFLDHDQTTREKLEAAFDPDKNRGNGFYGVKDNQDQFVSMTQDGKKAVTLQDNKTVVVWDLENAKKLHVLDHQDSVSCLKISKNGRWILTGNEKYQASLFDGITGEKLKTIGEHYGPIYSVGFFKNEKYACLGCKYGVLFFDIEKGIISHTLLTLGGILFFDSNGNYDCDIRATDFIAFRDKKTKEPITSWMFNPSGGTITTFQKMLGSKNKPGMLKDFLGAEDVNVLLDPKKKL